MRNGYVGIVSRLLGRSFIGIVAVGAVIAGIVVLGGRLPTGFLPLEDQGYLMVDVQLPDGAALERTEQVTQEMEEMLDGVEGVANVVTVNGYSILNSGLLSNGAMVIVTLTPWDDRQTPELRAEGILHNLWGRFSTIASANIIAFNPPPIPGLGTTGGVELKVQQTGAERLRTLLPRLVRWCIRRTRLNPWVLPIPPSAQTCPRYSLISIARRQRH